LEALGRFLKRAFPGNIRKQAETVIGPSGLTPAVKAEIEREVAKPPRRRPVRTSAEARAKIKEFERLHQSKSLHDAIGIALNLESGWPEGGRNARPMEQCRLLLLILNKGTTAVAGFSPKTKPEFPGAPKLEDFSPKERAAIAKASPEERVAILERAMEPRLAAYRQEFEKFQQQEAAYKDVEGIKKLVFDFVKEAFQTQDPKQVERLIEECITDPATQQLLKAAREAK